MKILSNYRIWELLGAAAWVVLLVAELIHCVKIVDLGQELPGSWWQLLKGVLLGLSGFFFFQQHWYYLSAQRLSNPYHLLQPLVIRSALLWLIATVPIMAYKFGAVILVDRAMMVAIPIIEIILLGFLIYWATDAYAVMRLLSLHGQNDAGRRYFHWFEYGLFGTLLLWGFGPEWETLSKLKTVINPLFLLSAVFFSFRQRWVVEVDAEKRRQSLFWTSMIGLLALVISYVFYGLIKLPMAMIGEIHGAPFLNTLLFFVMIYSVFSFIVILSNFPTSLVVEKRLQEVAAFKALGDQIRQSKDVHELYHILKESVKASIELDAVWIETDQGDVVLREGIELDTIEKIKLQFDVSQHDKIYPKTLNLGNYIPFGESGKGQSVMAVPLQSWDEQLGIIYLMKREANSLGIQAETLVTSFARQVSAAIHNLELLDQALSSERLKREMIIAKEIQQTLLPSNFDTNGKLQIHALARPAQEMGGDYYDFYRINDEQFMLVIADVSGNGVPAAFNMAEFKGIFQTLASQYLKPDELLAQANVAVSACFSRSRFITASVFLFYTAESKVYHARGGHCPALFWEQQKQQATYLEGKGLGLGILRNDKYRSHVALQVFDYSPGDLLVLYTDGITEAHDDTYEHLYGTKRLRAVVEQNAGLPIKKLADSIIDDVRQFSNDHLDFDDHSLVIIKF